jgi:hypothetical protein
VARQAEIQRSHLEMVGLGMESLFLSLRTFEIGPIATTFSKTFSEGCVAKMSKYKVDDFWEKLRTELVAHGD